MSSVGALFATVGFVAAFALWVFFLYGWRRQISGRATLLASTGTLLWMACQRASYADVPGRLLLEGLSVTAELGTYVLWFGVMLRILGVGPRHLRGGADRTKTVLLRATLAVSALTLPVGIALPVALALLPAELVAGSLLLDAVNTALLTAVVTGLLLVEQIARNTRRDHQWNVKLLVIALALLFGYGFVMYADALLFRRQSPAMSSAHGMVVALAAPLLALATARNRDRRLHVNLSRQLVLRTSSLLLMGAYLLLISLGGFWLQRFGGDWGAVLTVVLVTAAAVLGLVVATSRDARERLELLLAQNLFERKHDYRAAWLRLTETLLAEDPDSSLHQRAIRSLGELVHAHRGGLWRRSDAGALVPVAQLKMGWQVPFPPALCASLEAAVEAHPGPWDLAAPPEELPGDVVAALARLPEARLAIPLPLDQGLYGLVVLVAPETGQTIDWEDEELLSVAARQIASFLAQHDAQDLLADHRQLAAFNQMTAFVVHDIKTVVAQLSLLTRNAERHRHKPEFVDDMVATSRNAVERMQKLLDHLRARREGRAQEEAIALRPLLEALCQRQRKLAPTPTLGACADEAVARGDAETLASVLAHLVQNAQEATGEAGHVTLDCAVTDDWVEVRIRDDGCGMSEAFVREELFQPFRSTKGLTGMGIGSWQAREYVRSLGGDIRVESAPGRGSVFTVGLPRRVPEHAPSPGASAVDDP